MRALLAAVLSAYLALAAMVPHVHAGEHDSGEGCAVCLVRHAVEPGGPSPDVSPASFPAGDAIAAPGLPPVTGAPLGAIPGQSPPRAA